MKNDKIAYGLFEDESADPEVRAAMQKDVKIPEELLEKREEAFRKIRDGQKKHRRLGHSLYARIAGLAACACAAVIAFSGASYAVGADNLFSRSFARIVEATGGNKDYNQRKIETIAENAEEITAGSSSETSGLVSSYESGKIPADAQKADGQTSADAGNLVLRADEYYCDGKILAVTMEIEDKDGLLSDYDYVHAAMGEDSSRNPSLTINGQELGFPGDFYFQKDADGNFVTLKEINLRYHEVWDGCSFPDGSSLDVNISIPELETGTSGPLEEGDGSQRRKILGDWAVSFSGTCRTGGNHVIAENQARGDVMLNTVTRTPASVWVDLTVPQNCSGIDLENCGYAVNLVLEDGTIVQPEDGMSLNKNEEGIASQFGEEAWRFVNPTGEHFTVLVRAKDEQLTTLAEYHL